MTITRATTNDVPFIRDLAEKIWWDHYPEIITDEQIRYMLGEWYSEQSLTEQMTQLGHEFWMITPQDSDTPCGYLSLSRKEQPGSYYLNKFYIDGRGTGLGADAFCEILSHYPDMKDIRLNVNRRNFRSVNFYFKVGFKIESIMDLPVGDGFIMDDFVMLRNV